MKRLGVTRRQHSLPDLTGGDTGRSARPHRQPGHAANRVYGFEHLCSGGRSGEGAMISSCIRPRGGDGRARRVPPGGNCRAHALAAGSAIDAFTGLNRSLIVNWNGKRRARP
jgi:hypothetical protein